VSRSKTHFNTHQGWRSKLEVHRRLASTKKNSAHASYKDIGTKPKKKGTMGRGRGNPENSGTLGGGGGVDSES